MPTLQGDIGYAGAYPVGEGEVQVGHRVEVRFPARAGAVAVDSVGTIATVLVAIPAFAGARAPDPVATPAGTGAVLAHPRVFAGMYALGKGAVQTGLRIVAPPGTAGAFGQPAVLINVGIVVRPTGPALAGSQAREGTLIVGVAPPVPEEVTSMVVLDPAEIIASVALQVSAGLELLDQDDRLIFDISDDLQTGVVARNNEATIHGTCRLRISRQLNWHNQRLRPYLTLTDLITGSSARFDLGIFLPETPRRATGETPPTFDVEGYDKLTILDSPHGIAFTATAETRIVDAVERLLDERGLAHAIDQSSQTLLAASRSWPLDEQTTTLRIVNELLASISYTPLYADRNGIFRSEPFQTPDRKAPVWHYDTTDPRTIVGRHITEEVDLFAIPNRWVFVRDDPSQPAPVEGDGMYTALNQTDGPTSVASRGRVISKVVYLDAADQESLVALGNQIMQRDRQPLAVMTFDGSPNPLHWHAGAVTFTAPELGLEVVSFEEQSWSLPLDGSDMSHTVRRAVKL